MHRFAVASFALATLMLGPVGARAEPLPKPSVDFAVDGTITSGKGSNPATLRHGAGKMRVDADVDGHNAAIYIDLATHMATVVTQRMGQKIAMHIDPERAAAAANFMDRDARQVGESRIAGETCNEYEFETAKGRQIKACVTRDGIPLRTQDVTRNRVVWEARHVTRAPQSADVFAVPQDAVPLQIPKLK